MLVFFEEPRVKGGETTVKVVTEVTMLVGFEELEIGFDQRGVVFLTLCRPERGNVLTPKTMGELERVFSLCSDDGVRALVIRHTGKTFCAGADLGWMRGLCALPSENRRVELEALARVFRSLHEVPVPVVAAVNGIAYGGGIGLLCAADFVCVSATSEFHLPEARLGLLPAVIAPYLVAKFGAARATELAIAGTISAETAVTWGLATSLVQPVDLERETEALLQQILKCQPNAIRAVKEMFRGFATARFSEPASSMIAVLDGVLGMREAQDGLSQYFERRRPIRD